MIKKMSAFFQGGAAHPSRLSILHRPNLERWTAIVALLLVAVYIYLYSILQLDGQFVWDLNPGYFLILIPIWIIDGAKSSLETFMPRQYHRSEEDLSKVTVVIACINGEDIIGNTLDDLEKKFAPSQIIVVSNGSTDRTCEIVRKHGAICLEYEKPLGKVPAINEALPHVTTPYVLLLDDDTLINNTPIPTGLLDAGYEGVAFRVFVKKLTWVSYFQMHEYRKSSDIAKKYHNKRASVQNISGAIGLFRCRELRRQIKLHTGEFSGEDLQRTLLLHLATHTKGVVLADSAVYTLAPSTLLQLYRQRVFGWHPGLYANFRNFFKIMINKKTPPELRAEAFYTCFFVIILDLVRVLALPILIFYPWYFIIMYVTYVILEAIPYFKNTEKREPFWIILLYPLYGLFGLITRVGAFSVYLYRRFTVKIGKLAYLDDYRFAAYDVRAAGFLTASCVLLILLELNIFLNYSSLFTDYHLTVPSEIIPERLDDH